MCIGFQVLFNSVYPSSRSKSELEELKHWNTISILEYFKLFPSGAADSSPLDLFSVKSWPTSKKVLWFFRFPRTLDVYWNGFKKARDRPTGLQWLKSSGPTPTCEKHLVRTISETWTRWFKKGTSILLAFHAMFADPFSQSGPSCRCSTWSVKITYH